MGILVGVALASCGGASPGDDASSGDAIPVATSDDVAAVVRDADDGTELALSAGDHRIDGTLVVDRDITLTGAGSDPVRIVRSGGVTT